MLKIAWKTVQKGRTTRGTNNHYTEDKQFTLCGKKIPAGVASIFEAKKTCDKCLARKEIIDLSTQKASDRAEHFKQVVAKYGGNYEDGLDGWHMGRWEEAKIKDMYHAYAVLATAIAFGDNLNLMDRLLTYKPKVA